RNYPEWIFSYAAIASIGAVAIAVNSLWTADEMAHGLNLSQPKVLLADQERIDRVTSLASPPDGMRIIGVRTTKPLPANATPWSDIAAQAEKTAMPVVDVAPDDDLQMLFTSGSTGNPKGA